MNEQVIDAAMDDIEAPIWPKPVGVLSAVWGVVGIGCGLCGTAAMSVPMFVEAGMRSEFPDGFPPTLVHPPVELYLLAAAGAVLALFLIACGVVLLLRKPAARPMHLVYSIMALVIAAASIWFNLRYQAELKQWNIDNPTTKWAQQQAANPKWIETAGMAFGLFIGLAWPTFCLVWFGAIKRDSKEIARGVETLV